MSRLDDLRLEAEQVQAHRDEYYETALCNPIGLNIADWETMARRVIESQKRLLRHMEFTREES